MTYHGRLKKTIKAMEPMNEIKIMMTEEDARLFLLFQEHYPTFKLLVERGVFEQRNAAVTLHFDSVGTLQVIQRADSLYSRKHS